MEFILLNVLKRPLCINVVIFYLTTIKIREIAVYKTYWTAYLSVNYAYLLKNKLLNNGANLANCQMRSA